MSEEKGDAPSRAPHEAQGQEQAQWRPIKTAPRDGKRILVAHESNGCVFTVEWDEDAFGWIDGATDLYGDFLTYQPSHWMPLPEPPSAAGHIPSELAQDGARTHSPNVERGER